MNPEFMLPIWKEWYDRYTEPHRRYHTPSHIFRMFEIARENKIPLDNNEIMAIWFHDIVYNIPKKELASNEELSADFFMECHDSGMFDDVRINPLLVSSIIRDTEKEIPTSCGDQMWSRNVIDLDLWDLCNETKYRKNAKLVHDEFVPVYGFDKFLQGRAEWIDDMLARDSIYVGEYPTVVMERMARCNLRKDDERMNDPEEWKKYYGVE